MRRLELEREMLRFHNEKLKGTLAGQKELISDRVTLSVSHDANFGLGVDGELSAPLGAGSCGTI